MLQRTRRLIPGSKARGAGLPGVLAGITFAAGVLSAAEYHVQRTAPAGGDGSAARPLSTIQSGLNRLRAGDTLWVRGTASGETYTEALSLPASGTSSAPVSVRVPAGEKVIVTGASGSSSNRLSLNRDHWIFDGFTFDHNGIASDALKISGSHNVLRNCEVRNGSRDGIDITGGDGNRIERSKVHDFRWTAGDAHGIVVNGGSDLVIRESEIFDCSGDCVQIYHGTATRTRIEDNRLYTTRGACSENAVDIKSCFSPVVRRNVMHGFRVNDGSCAGTGSDGVAVVVHHEVPDALIELNDIFDCEGGVRITLSSGGTPSNATVQRNTIHDLVNSGVRSTTGYGIQLDGVNGVKIHHNTLVNIPNYLFWVDSNGAADPDIRNNLFVRTGGMKGTASLFTGTRNIDYNGYFETGMEFGEPHALRGDPRFADLAGRNYRLSAASPCIDRGTALGHPFVGSAPDLGAHEFAAGQDVIPPAAPTGLRITE